MTFLNGSEKWVSTFGKKCVSMDGETYTLVGMSETFEDYYYILQKEDGTKSHHSCVGRVEFI